MNNFKYSLKFNSKRKFILYSSLATFILASVLTIIVSLIPRSLSAYIDNPNLLVDQGFNSYVEYPDYASDINKYTFNLSDEYQIDSTGKNITNPSWADGEPIDTDLANGTGLTSLTDFKNKAMVPFSNEWNNSGYSKINLDDDQDKLNHLVGMYSIDAAIFNNEPDPQGFPIPEVLASFTAYKNLYKYILDNPNLNDENYLNYLNTNLKNEFIKINEPDYLSYGGYMNDFESDMFSSQEFISQLSFNSGSTINFYFFKWFQTIESFFMSIEPGSTTLQKKLAFNNDYIGSSGIIYLILGSSFKLKWFPIDWVLGTTPSGTSKIFVNYTELQNFEKQNPPAGSLQDPTFAKQYLHAAYLQNPEICCVTFYEVMKEGMQLLLSENEYNKIFDNTSVNHDFSLDFGVTPFVKGDQSYTYLTDPYSNKENIWGVSKNLMGTIGYGSSNSTNQIFGDSNLSSNLFNTMERELNNSNLFSKPNPEINLQQYLIPCEINNYEKQKLHINKGSEVNRIIQIPELVYFDGNKTSLLDKNKIYLSSRSSSLNTATAASIDNTKLDSTILWYDTGIGTSHNYVPLSFLCNNTGQGPSITEQMINVNIKLKVQDVSKNYGNQGVIYIDQNVANAIHDFKNNLGELDGSAYNAKFSEQSSDLSDTNNILVFQPFANYGPSGEITGKFGYFNAPDKTKPDQPSNDFLNNVTFSTHGWYGHYNDPTKTKPGPQQQVFGNESTLYQINNDTSGPSQIFINSAFKNGFYQTENLLNLILSFTFVILVAVSLLLVIISLNSVIMANEKNLIVLKILGEKNRNIFKKVFAIHGIFILIAFLLAIPLSLFISNIVMAQALHLFDLPYFNVVISIKEFILTVFLLAIFYGICIYISLLTIKKLKYQKVMSA